MVFTASLSIGSILNHYLCSPTRISSYSFSSSIMRLQQFSHLPGILLRPVLLLFLPHLHFLPSLSFYILSHSVKRIRVCFFQMFANVKICTSSHKSQMFFLCICVCVRTHVHAYVCMEARVDTVCCFLGITCFKKFLFIFVLCV